MKKFISILIAILISGFLFAETTNDVENETESRPRRETTNTETTTESSPETTPTPEREEPSTQPARTPTVSPEQRLLNAIASNPRNESAYMELIRLYGSQGRYSDRIRITLQALQNLGDSANLYMIVGDDYRILGDFSKSLVSYQFALRLAPTGSDIYNRMGLTLLRLSNFHQAEAAFRGAVFFSSDTRPVAKGVYLNNLGVSFEAREEFESAANFFREALRYYPSYDKAQDNLRRVEQRN
jgi:tetratricopeptide (TPR) repeat protein